MAQKHGSPGQSTKVKTSTAHNMPGGGAAGQTMGKRNKACKPQHGAQGQKKAGGHRY